MAEGQSAKESQPPGTLDKSTPETAPGNESQKEISRREFNKRLVLMGILGLTAAAHVAPDAAREAKRLYENLLPELKLYERLPEQSQELMRGKMLDALSAVMDPKDIPAVQKPISMERDLYVDEIGHSFNTYFLSPDYYQGNPYTDPIERYYEKVSPNTVGDLHMSVNFKKYNHTQGEPVLVLDYYPEQTGGKRDIFSQRLELGLLDHAEVSLDIAIDDNSIPTLFLPGVREAIRKSHHALFVDEAVNPSDIPTRHKVFEEMQGLIGKFLKLPKNIKMLPDLNLDGFKLFGDLPNGDKFYAEVNPWIDPKNALGIRVKFGHPDSWIWNEHMEEASYEFAAEDSIRRMDRLNESRHQKGLSPVLATDDLNQVRQGLSL